MHIVALHPMQLLHTDGRKKIGRKFLKKFGKKRKQDRGRKVEKRVHRDVVEGRFWRDQRKFRPLVVGWERKADLFKVFIEMGFVMI